MFEPIAVENLGAISSSVRDFLLKLGRRVYSQSEGASESSYLFQRISVAIQRFNSVLLRDTLTVDIPDTELLQKAALLGTAPIPIKALDTG